MQVQVWRHQQRDRRKRTADWSIAEATGHVKPHYGVQEQGAELYRSTWCYQPLIVSLAGTGECLAIRNRPGNFQSSDGTAEVLDEELPHVQQRGGQILVRGDSDFDPGDIGLPARAAAPASRSSVVSCRIAPSSSRS